MLRFPWGGGGGPKNSFPPLTHTPAPRGRADPGRPATANPDGRRPPEFNLQNESDILIILEKIWTSYYEERYKIMYSVHSPKAYGKFANLDYLNLH